MSKPGVGGGFSDEQVVPNQSQLENFTCTICQKLKKNAVELPCQHSFCRECIGRWQCHSETCPLCRQAFRAYGDFKPMEIKEVNILCRYSCGWNGRICDENTHYLTCVNAPSVLKVWVYDSTVCPLCDNKNDQRCLTCEAGLTDHSNCDWVVIPCNHGYHTECLARWRRTHSFCKVCNKEI
jgi:hypothetical protein